MTLESLQGGEDLPGRVAADADEDGHAPGDEGHRSLDDRLHLVLVQGRALARRAERKDAAHALTEVVLEQPLVAGEVDGAIHERRDDRWATKRPATWWSRASWVRERGEDSARALRRRAPPPALGVSSTGTPAGSCRSRA